SQPVAAHLPFCLCIYATRLYLHSFPTRRSSDLYNTEAVSLLRTIGSGAEVAECDLSSEGGGEAACDRMKRWSSFGRTWIRKPSRSEEHTSELQSRENLVCRLLLEKKKRQSAAIR